MGLIRTRSKLSPGQDVMKPEQAELERLRKENAKLRMERDLQHGVLFLPNGFASPTSASSTLNRVRINDVPGSTPTSSFSMFASVSLPQRSVRDLVENAWVWVRCGGLLRALVRAISRRGELLMASGR